MNFAQGRFMSQFASGLPCSQMYLRGDSGLTSGAVSSGTCMACGAGACSAAGQSSCKQCTTELLTKVPETSTSQGIYFDTFKILSRN